MDDASMPHRAISDRETERRPSGSVWMVAAAGALAAHVAGAALVIANLPAGESETELGAEAIEIGVTMSSPQAAPTDAPAGPDAEAAAAAPAQADQKAVVEETELPKEVP